MQSDPWLKSVKSKAENQAIVILIFTTFILPQLIHRFLGTPFIETATVTSILGLTVFYLLTPGECGFKALPTAQMLPVIIAGVLLIPTVGIVTWSWQQLLNSAGFDFPFEQPLLPLIRACSIRQAIQLFIVVCIISPILEELLFRRLIYGKIVHWGKWKATVIISVLFSIVHLFPPAMPGLAILGFGFHFIFLKTGNLTTAALLHIMVNATTFICTIYEK